MSAQPSKSDTIIHAGFLRRMGAILYDGLILIALVMLATAAVMPLTHGEAIHSGNPLLQTYLFLVCFGYFAWFWSHGGQTIGMRAWRLRVQRLDGSPLTLWQILLRFLAAIGSWLLFGSGFLYALFNRQHQTWHDRFSESELIVLEKNTQSLL